MNVEHVFQIGVSIDDDSIRDAILKKCTKDVSEALENGFLKSSYNGQHYIDTKLDNKIMKVVKEYLEKHNDEIIEVLVEKMADKIFRSRKTAEKVVAAFERRGESKDGDI